MTIRVKVRVEVTLAAELELDYDPRDFEASQFGKSIFSQALDRYLETKIDEGEIELPEWSTAGEPYELDRIVVSR